MKCRKKIFVSFMLVLMMLATMNTYAVEADTADNRDSFNIYVEDESGNAVDSAQVYLYCFQPRDIVASGISSEDGTCEFSYMPELELSEEENLDQTYRDFLIYVDKNGYIPQSYSLTKYYGLESKNESDFKIVLKTDCGMAIQTDMDTELAADINNIVKAQEPKPFYVIMGEDLSNTVQSEASVPDSYYWNVDVPIGHFHADKNSILNVTFSASDSVTVKSGVKISGIFNIVGSRTRTLGSSSSYAAFTATSSRAQEKTYYTGARFVRYYVLNHRTGITEEHYDIDSINGGTYTGTAKNCYMCGADWDEAWTDYGNCIKIENGSSVEISQFKNQTLDLGLSVPLSDIGVDFSLGVTFNTSSGTSMKYAPKAGYKLRIYDADGSAQEWHVTSVAS